MITTERLRPLFGDMSLEAIRILSLTEREDLEELPGVREWMKGLYNPHRVSVRDMKLQALNQLGGFHGVESFDTPDGPCEYLNAGNAYSQTILVHGGKWIVGCWGDIAERYLDLE